jgi:hypothetical protein
MLLEVTRLALGLMIAIFHRPLADWILEQDRQLVLMARSRGVPLPAAPTTETARTLYFCIGIFVAIYEILRIWVLYC